MKQTIAKQRWLRLIPIAFITYSLAYLDRANYGFGAASGLAEDLSHYSRYIIFTRFIILLRLFLFPSAGCGIC